MKLGRCLPFVALGVLACTDRSNKEKEVDDTTSFYEDGSFWTYDFEGLPGGYVEIPFNDQSVQVGIDKVLSGEVSLSPPAFVLDFGRNDSLKSSGIVFQEGKKFQEAVFEKIGFHYIDDSDSVFEPSSDSIVHLNVSFTKKESVSDTVSYAKVYLDRPPYGSIEGDEAFEIWGAVMRDENPNLPAVVRVPIPNVFGRNEEFLKQAYSHIANEEDN